MIGDINILIVDDDLKIADLLKIHFLSMGEVYCRTVESAQKALVYLEKEEFHVVVTDFRMPEIDGLEFLKRVKAKYPNIIKVLFTGFGDLNSIQEELREGEIAYFISKPWQQAQLRILLDAVRRDLETKNLIQDLSSELELIRTDANMLRERLEKNTRGSINMLREMLQNSSSKVASHCRRTAIISTNLARRLGMDHESIQKLEWSALLHDFALSSETDQVQEGIEVYLSGNQKEIFRSHPDKMSEMLNNLDLFESVSDIIKKHHENLDGSGFYGYKEGQIPPESKILRICDYYDEEQTYNRNAHKNVLDFMKMYQGKWFDKTYFDEFFVMMKALKR